MEGFITGLTAAGLKLLLNAMNGQRLEFTSITLGAGKYTGVTSGISACVDPKITLPLKSLKVKDSKAVMQVVLSYSDIEDGFTWTEYTVNARNLDTGEELAYGYAYWSGTGNPIPTKGSTSLKEIVLTVTVVVSDAATVTALIDNTQVWATAEDIEKVESSVENITNVITNITTGSGEYGSTVVTLNHKKAGTAHAFTGLEGRTGLIPCQFKSSAGYAEGDTATIDGEGYTITLTGADAPETDLFIAGKSILVDVDTEGKTINFKAGGGLTKAKLALATATEETVFAGKTFYADGKELRTGTHDPDWAIRAYW